MTAAQLPVMRIVSTDEQSSVEQLTSVRSTVARPGRAVMVGTMSGRHMHDDPYLGAVGAAVPLLALIGGILLIAALIVYMLGG